MSRELPGNQGVNDNGIVRGMRLRRRRSRLPWIYLVYHAEHRRQRRRSARDRDPDRENEPWLWD